VQGRQETLTVSPQTTPHFLHDFRNTGKPRLAQEDTAKITDY